MHKKRTTHFSLEFSDEKVTAFGGMILPEQIASHLGLWNILEKHLPDRNGDYSWIEIIRAAVAGLLTGSRGTYATQELRGDEALLRLLDLDGAPEEATFWRCLEGLGEMSHSGILGEVQAAWTRKILGRCARRVLLECDGFIPIFADGTLLEGSRRREGTKYLKDKGRGLLWTTIFVGPLIAAQRIAARGEGEITLARKMLAGVVKKVLKPLRLSKKALFLADSLHGNGPTLDEVERLKLRYVVGGGGLPDAERVIAEQPESQWHDLGQNEKCGWRESAVCVCWFQSAKWKKKRLLVGRRVWREGELFPRYYCVLTNLTQKALTCKGHKEFAQKVWRLYDAKGRMELRYQEVLSDLDMHHPPCQEHMRNLGYYTLGTFAHTLGVGVKLLGGREEKPPKDGMPKRVHVRPRGGMRLWRMRRRLFSVPARIVRHARHLRVIFLGASEEVSAQLREWSLRLSRC